LIHKIYYLNEISENQLLERRESIFRDFIYFINIVETFSLTFHDAFEKRDREVSLSVPRNRV